MDDTRTTILLFCYLLSLWVPDGRVYQVLCPVIVFEGVVSTATRTETPPISRFKLSGGPYTIPQVFRHCPSEVK